jgi:sulfur relay (sulfurtransferase) DsrF/TusC family protein
MIKVTINIDFFVSKKNLATSLLDENTLIEEVTELLGNALEFEFDAKDITIDVDVEER